MTPDKDMLAESTVLMDRDAIAATVRSLALAISDANPDIGALVLLGILRRGRPLADRLAALIGEYTGTTPPVGSLATTMYRDDVRTGAAVPQMKGETHFDFSVDDRTVLLVDDVLAAGRTIRAALDEVGMAVDLQQGKQVTRVVIGHRSGRGGRRRHERLVGGERFVNRPCALPVHANRPLVGGSLRHANGQLDGSA